MVEKADKIEVTLFDGKQTTAKVIGTDPMTDLALIKVELKGLNPVKLGDSDKVEVGDWAVAIGNPLGLDYTVTAGIISAKQRDIFGGTAYGQFLQTDAAINPGNSGGPLFDDQGQVIGINTAIAQGQGLGFAIPINVARDALNNFNTTGQFNRPFLGVEFQMIPRQTAVLNDLPEGAYIQSVVDASPAQIAGLQNEDIITKIDGDKLSVDNDLAKVISKKKVGDHATLTVWRDEKEVTLTVTLGTQEQ